MFYKATPWKIIFCRKKATLLLPGSLFLVFELRIASFYEQSEIIYFDQLTDK